MSLNGKTPIDVRRSMHLVFKSRGGYGFHSMVKKKNNKFIRETLNNLAIRYNFKIYNFANVGTHLHLLVKARDRELFIKFLRVFPSKIALFILGAKKGSAKGPYWAKAVFLRIVNWGKDFSNVMFYVLENAIQGAYEEIFIMSFDTA